MYPHTHFLFAFLIGEFFVKLGLFSHSLAFLTAILAILVDFDHFVEHFITTKDKNNKSLKRFWNNSVLKNDPRERTWLHLAPGFIIFLAVPVIISLFSVKAALVIVIAYWSHMLLDYIRIHILRHLVKIKEFGFHLPIYEYEVVLDFAFLFGIIAILTKTL